MERADVERGVVAFLSTMRRECKARTQGDDSRVPLFEDLSIADRNVMVKAMTNAIVTARSKPKFHDTEETD